MKKALTVLLVAALIGFVASVLLTRLHYKIGAKGFEEKSFCNVSEFIDCDAAIASRYAKAGPFLTSEIGIIYYLLVSGMILFAWFSEKWRQGTLGFLFLSSIGAVAYSLVMAYLSIFKLGTLCLICLTVYLVNLVLLVVLPPALKVRTAAIPRFLADYVRSIFGKGTFPARLGAHLGVTLLVFGVGLLFFKGLNPKIHEAQAQVPREAYLKVFYAAPVKEIDLQGSPSWGREDGKVTIVEFSDFQCPFCRRAAFTLKPYLKEFRNDVRLVFKNYPLDSSCNPAIAHAMHPVSCIAAKGVLCAQRMGKFWEYHDKVFANQKKLSRTLLLNLAAESGFDRNAFEQCLASDEISQALAKDVEQGNRLEVKGTPTIYLNGRLFRDWMNSDRLRMVIEEEARRLLNQ